MKNSRSYVVLFIVSLGITMYFVKSLPVTVLLDAGPWWVYFVMAGILISGYLSFSYMLEDKKIDEQFIEKEGQVYIDRIRAKSGGNNG